MKLELFDFELPQESIAQEAAEPRDSARMLVVPEDGAFVDAGMRDLPGWLEPGDVMVFNNTRVIPARLYGRRGEARVEVLLHQDRGDGLEPSADWWCFARPGKRLRVGDVVRFGEALSAEVMEKREDGQVGLRFSAKGAALREALEIVGEMPLPPYIARPEGATEADKARYQTVFAKHDGAVAAPTAGLHYTPELLAAIEARGVRRVEVTLHVGAGTFLPVKAEDTRDHVMHSEWGEVTAEVAEVLNAAKRVVAVGTTSLRLVESATDEDGVVRPFRGDTAIFITPGYRFRRVDVLATNFHLPKSTLFMLVSAFSGRERMLAAYRHAIEAGYRFYSYGDGCLLFPSPPSSSGLPQAGTGDPRATEHTG